MRHSYSVFLAVCLLTTPLVLGQSTSPTTLPSETIPDCLGVNAHYGAAPLPGDMEELAAGGFKWARVDFLWNQSWSHIESVKGVYDFSRHDPVFDGLARRHIRIVCVLSYGNVLYDKGLSPYTDEGRRAFAAYAVAAAKHYAGRGILWEVWNEPNGHLFWHPYPNASNYAKLAIAVGQAFQKEVPNEMLIGPALSKMDWPFLETCLKAGCLQYWSAVSVHPYRDDNPETVAPDYAKLRAMIARYAPPGKNIPLLSSEWGYPSIGAVTPEIQGKYLARQFLTNISNEIPVSIWYDWHDDGVNSKNPENDYGVVDFAYRKGQDPVYEPKPAYFAAKTLTSYFAGYQFSKRLLLDSPDDYVLVFKRGGDVRLAAWTTGPAHDVMLPVSAGTFADMGFTGDALPALTSDASGLKMQLTDSPQYLSAQTPNDLLSIIGAWQGLPMDVKVTAPTKADIATMLTNPTQHPIHVHASTGQTLDLAPGQSGTISMSVPVLRSLVHEAFRIDLEIAGQHLVQETHLEVSNPFDVTLLPVGAKTILATVENRSLQAFAGTIHFDATEGAQHVAASAPLQFAAGEREISVQADAAEDLPLNPQLDVKITSADGQTVADSVIAYDSEPAKDLASYTLYPGKNQSFSPAEAPQPPATLTGPVMRLDYRYIGKSKTPEPGAPVPVITLTLGPPKKPSLKLIHGKPNILEMWVFGDGSGNGVCARFADSTGQVFQPQSAITWKGWKLLSLPLDDRAVWHYGGAKDGVIHYPITWNTLFLMDSAGHVTRSGTIYLASPTVVWDAPPQAAELKP